MSIPELIKYKTSTEESNVLISVIVPVYKPGKYFKQCLVSLFEQTLQNVEYIFVDDSGKDENYIYFSDTLEKYENRQSQVQYIKNPVNIGCCRSRAKGIEHAKGKYIYFCDHDDEVLPTMLEEMTSLAEKENLDMVYCDVCHINNMNGGCIEKEPQKYGCNPVKEDLIYHLLSVKSYGIAGCLWNRIIRRDIFSNNDIYYTEHQIYEDCLAVYQMLIYSTKFGYIKKPFFRHWEHPNSESYNSKNPKEAIRKITNAQINLKAIEMIAKKNNLYKSFYNNSVMLKIVAISMFSDHLKNNLKGRLFLIQNYTKIIPSLILTNAIPFRYKLSMIPKFIAGCY